MALNFQAKENQVATEVTFYGYKISADAKPLDCDTWTGSYIIEKDGRVVRVRHSVTWRGTAKLAEAGALVFAIHFVDNCMAARRTAAMVRGEE
jgi:hypothetical protein